MIPFLALVLTAMVVTVAAAIRPRARPRVPAEHARPAGAHRPGRMDRRAREQLIDRVYPDALDLFVVTVQAGLRPLEAMRSLRPLVDPVIGDAFAEVLARVDRGERFPDALTSLTAALGARGAVLVDTLTMTDRAGLPIGPAIDRLGDDARRHRRRSADADARQLPVRLSFPLVLCTLTSFVLVAIVPLLLGALTSFDRSSP